MTSSCSEHFFSCFEKNSGSAEIREVIKLAERNRLFIASVFFFGSNPDFFKEFRDIAGRYPSFFLGGKGAGGLNGIIVKAYSGKRCDFHYIREKGLPIGAYFFCGDIHFVTLAGFLAPRKESQKKSAGVYSAYTAALKLIEKRGFGIKDVCRFWNFLHDMPDYKELNGGRDRCFSKRFLTSYPAATGIQALHPAGAYYQLGLEAVRSESVDMRRETIHSLLQCDPWQYGPKFSRAVLIEAKKDSLKKMYVSGTSSIDCAGRSVCLDNALENVTYVLSCVKHILQKKNMGLKNIAMSVIYCKTAELFKLFESIYAKRKWDFPYVPLVTDICRKELLFEMECVAADSVKTDIPSGLSER